MLLAVDTSTRTVGLALYDGAQVMYELAWTSNDFHTVELAPAVTSMLERCDQEVSALQAIAVAIGPGSFTGLRIGLALAKGLALVRHIPLIGIPSLDVLAAAQPTIAIPMAAVLRAGRGRRGPAIPAPCADNRVALPWPRTRPVPARRAIPPNAAG